MRSAGVEPFALSFDPTASTAEIRARFGAMPSQQMAEEGFTIAGRVVMARRFGKLTFLVLRDRSGDLQIVCNLGDLDALSAALLRAEHPTWTARQVAGVLTTTATDIDAPGQDELCEALSFTPWHSLPEHEPVGGINRLRRAVRHVGVALQLEEGHRGPPAGDGEDGRGPGEVEPTPPGAARDAFEQHCERIGGGAEFGRGIAALHHLFDHQVHA